MIKKIFLYCTLFAAVPAHGQFVDKVNTIIGTNGMGHTFPGACVPFGAVQVSPDTDTIPHNVGGVYQPRAYEYCAGYQHKDSSIVGFSHTHFSGTGHSDLGDILLIPTTGALKLNPGTAVNPDSGYRSRFSHDTEVSRPGYYEVMLADYGVKAQLTATKRAGIHKYTYPQGANQRVILDMIHGIYNYDGKVLWTNIRVENDTLVTGYRITNGWARTNYTYFAMSFSKPIVNYGCDEKAKVNYRGGYGKFNMKENFPDIGGRKIVAYFDFDPSASSDLEVKVAISGVSTDGALKNLRAETTGKSFEQLAALAADNWNEALSVLDAKGSDDQITMLYTSLYHTMINPSVYGDVDGQYRGVDLNIHQADGFTNYTVFSLWDTYRALHPLFNIINRGVNTDMVKSMMKHCEQSVHHALPIWSHMGNENWCMIGYHAVSVLSDAIAKGLPIDREAALKAMESSSNVPYYDGTAEWVKLGFVPLERSGSAASLSLEYGYDDWAIYQAAKLSGKMQLADRYLKRSENYAKIFDPETKYARPRHSDGSWKKNFSLLDTHGQGFIEGNALNYSFYVPQDVNGMIRLMGGDKQFVSRLDSLFTIHLPAEFFAHTEDVTEEGLLGGYVHGNEPSHHIPFLYNWTSQPWKTQYWQREIMNKMYRNNIDGLCGNDDCGQMSAWYIFSAMGFYPVCPGTDQYVLGAPYLPYIKVRLENGKTFEVKADKVSDKNRYVKAVRLNGKPYAKGYITQKDIMDGGVLEFDMASSPNKKRVFTGENRPYSLTDGKTVADASEPWNSYDVGKVIFKNVSPDTRGSKIYAQIIPNPDAYIQKHARKVLETLYFSPEDSIPGIREIHYTLKDYKGVSAKDGAPPSISIVYSTSWIEKSFGQRDTAKVDYETRGVLYHELTHGFQLEPQGIGTYGTNKTFWAMIEGVADAVRCLNGCFKDEDRPKGGNYNDGYRTTGFFFAWLTHNKDKDFLRKLNRSTLEVIPWSFEGGIQYALGKDQHVEDLWKEYQKAMGDI